MVEEGVLSAKKEENGRTASRRRRRGRSGRCHAERDERQSGALLRSGPDSLFLSILMLASWYAFQDDPLTVICILY